MVEEGSFRVVLNFAQMAAIITHESLTPAEIRSNRIFGSLRLVGGIVELVGSRVLCALPEPTMISKLGCVALGVHASDQLAAATHQVMTGEETNAYSYKGGASVAEMIGASQKTGQVIGLATEFMVPLSVATLYNAFRVSSIRAGRMTVAVSEKPLHVPKKSPGGHTLRDHFQKDLPSLQKRLRKVRSASAVSTFERIEIAEWAVSQALKENRLKIMMFSKTQFVRKGRRLVLNFDAGQNIGWGILRTAPDTPVSMTKIRVIVEFVEFNYMPRYILTAFPIP
ncbi:RNase A-like domain-containing protein [Pseudomonas monteilii]